MNPLITHPALGKVASEVLAVLEHFDSAISDPMGTGLSQGERASLFYPAPAIALFELLKRYGVTARQLDNAIRARTSDRWAFFHFQSVEDFVTEGGRPDLSDAERYLR